MRKRVYAVGIRASLAAIALLFATVAAAHAQLTTTIAISDPHGEIEELLGRGRQLEVERRWGEALAVYEDAIRRYPKEPELHERFDGARLHYDVERRYADRSFLDSLSRLSTERALNLYAQVLLKIESHYVETPRWKDMLDRGTNNLRVALSEPIFFERNVPRHNRLAVEAFQDELRRTVEPWSVVSRAEARQAVSSVARLAQQRLEINPTVVVLEYLCGATNALDPYSAYLTPNQLNEVYAQIEGNFVGLGVELKARDGGLVIVGVISGSPAERAGVRVGDRIIAVDGRSTAEMSTDQAANLLQGPEGSTVALTLAAPEQPARKVAVVRRVVEVPSVDRVGIIDRRYGVGYIQLTCFQKTTARDLDAALWKLHREGMRSLVIDVRNNPGGLLMSAVEVADRFIERGIIVSTRGRSAAEDFTYSAHDIGKWRMPLVVIIDQDSASAAEIFAGAIRDHMRGKIVGAKSFGKGSVQGIFPLEEANCGVRLTTAKFYSPSGRPFSRVGVEPDIIVRAAARPINGRLPDGEDAMLAAAAEAARNLTQPLQARNSQ
ncbi:MAG: S41 family peptidase [Pirellulales bacterium]|nr:S41 family peptidase [Pirellulales bacterium]